MTRTIVVCGYGPGISDGVARRFGAEGFRVALVARSKDKLERGASALSEAGIEARGFPCDLGDPGAVRAMIAEVRAALGPITVVHWNAYAGLAGDVLSADVEALRTVLDVGVTGLVVAVQEALPDLKSQDGAAVLVTGGGFAFYDPKVDAMAVQYQAMGLAVAKAAQHKLTGLLHTRLATEGVFVGEVIVLGMVKGTAFDSGHATLEPSAIGAKFWELYEARSASSTQIA